MGLQSTASAGSNKPTQGISIGSSSTSEFWTVPTGKYFVGVIFARSHQYGFRIHSDEGTATICNGGSSNETQTNHPVNITLYEGMGVSSGNSSYTVGVAGVLYDI